MEVSSNGWPVLAESETKRWKIPGSLRTIPLRRSDAGFVLIHFTMTFNETIESLDESGWDDWGWGVRKIAGTDVWSNHASGTAVDLNSLSHPSGVRGTFVKLWKVVRIRKLLATKYKGKITWGGSWNKVDEMHFEINCPEQDLHPLAVALRNTDRGRRIHDVNSPL